MALDKHVFIKTRKARLHILTTAVRKILHACICTLKEVRYRCSERLLFQKHEYIWLLFEVPLHVVFWNKNFWTLLAFRNEVVLTKFSSFFISLRAAVMKKVFPLFSRLKILIGKSNTLR